MLVEENGINEEKNQFELRKILKFTQFCNLYRARGKITVLNIAAEAFEARYCY